MPRRREAEKREILPDPKYNNTLVTRFMNSMMVQGKKSLAEGIFYGALDQVGTRFSDEKPLDVFKKAVERKVAFVTGDAFLPEDHRNNVLRLAFSNLPEDRIEKGIEILADVLRGMIH